MVGHCFFLCPLRLWPLRSPLPRDHGERLLLAELPSFSAGEACARHWLGSSQESQHQRDRSGATFLLPNTHMCLWFSAHQRQVAPCRRPQMGPRQRRWQRLPACRQGLLGREAAGGAAETDSGDSGQFLPRLLRGHPAPVRGAPVLEPQEESPGAPLGVPTARAPELSGYGHKCSHLGPRCPPPRRSPPLPALPPLPHRQLHSYLSSFPGP